MQKFFVKVMDKPILAVMARRSRLETTSVTYGICGILVEGGVASSHGKPIMPMYNVF